MNQTRHLKSRDYKETVKSVTILAYVWQKCPILRYLLENRIRLKDLSISNQILKKLFLNNNWNLANHQWPTYYAKKINIPIVYKTRKFLRRMTLFFSSKIQPRFFNPSLTRPPVIWKASTLVHRFPITYNQWKLLTQKKVRAYFVVRNWVVWKKSWISKP